MGAVTQPLPVPVPPFGSPESLAESLRPDFPIRVIPPQRLASGTWTSPVGQRSASGPVLNRLSVCPLWLPEPVTIDRIGCEVTTAGTAANVVRLGIYAADEGPPAENWPGSLMADFGTVDVTSTGAKELAVSAQLPAGLVWLAACCQVSAASLVMRSLLSNILAPVALPGGTDSATGAIQGDRPFPYGGSDIVNGAFPPRFTTNPANPVVTTFTPIAVAVRIA